MALSKFLAAVVAALPEAEQAKATALFEANPKALETAADLDGRIHEADALQTYRGELKTWAETKEAEFAAKAAAKAPAAPGDKTPADQTPNNNMVDRKTFDAAISDVTTTGLSLMSYLTTVGIRHFQTFGEALDIDALIRNPKANQIGVKALYEETYKDQYAAKAKAASDARDESLRKEGREAAQKEFAGATPLYPVPGKSVAPIDQFTPGAAKPDAAQYSIDAAVAAYTALAASNVN